MIRTTLPLVAGLALIAVGCAERPEGAAIDPELQEKYRQQFVLAEEPADVMAVLDVREMFTGPADDPGDHVAIDEGDDAALADEELDIIIEDDGSESESPTADVTMAVNEPQQVAVVGKVGGMPNPWQDEEPDFPWKNNSATLFLVDPATASELADHGHDHSADDHHDCPFCARAAAENVNAIAVVNFLGDDGQVVPVRADKLLPISEKETVVVTGRARLMGGKLLVIDADGVYVRR